MSCDNIAIRVDQLGKRYQIYETPRDRLKQFVLPRLYTLAGAKPKPYFQEFWALTDVSFEVKQGETVGIIGRNGSGKSTLLQMVCGTLYPTHGHVEVNGRVAALLELGAGFNPEFTGRENIFMNGALLGLSRQEIEARYDEIVAFADIGMFIDQPVKMYSSGMFVRVAFAIAASLDPSILIVDEALAVGDLAFQAKCMVRLRRLMDAGTTILFVSHDMSSVRNICSKVLWLKQGRAVALGGARKVVDAYVAEMNLDINRISGGDSSTRPPEDLPSQDSEVVDASQILEASGVLETFGTLQVSGVREEFKAPQVPNVSQAFKAFGASGMNLRQPPAFLDAHTRYGDGRATVLDVVVLNGQGEAAELIELHDPYTIRIVVKANADIERAVIGYSLRDFKGNPVVGAMNSNFPHVDLPSFEAGKIYCIDMSARNVLAQGGYTVSVGIENIVHLNKVHQYLDVIENARMFQSTYGAQTENIFPAMVWQSVAFDFREITVSVAA